MREQKTEKERKGKMERKGVIEDKEKRHEMRST